MSTIYSRLNMNEEERTAFQDWLRLHLSNGIVTVDFIKKDDSLRTMSCTTNEELVEAYVRKTDRKSNPELCFVYDIEAKAWRSFRFDSLTSVRFDLE